MVLGIQSRRRGYQPHRWSRSTIEGGCAGKIEPMATPIRQVRPRNVAIKLHDVGHHDGHTHAVRRVGHGSDRVLHGMGRSRARRTESGPAAVAPSISLSRAMRSLPLSQAGFRLAEIWEIAISA